MWPTEQNRRAWEGRYGHEEERAHLPDAVRERLPDLSGKHVLHLPCGTGGVTADLLATGALVTGIDPSAEALAVAREQVSGAAFFQAEPHDIPLQLRRRRFSAVYAGPGVLELVTDLDLLAGTLAAALRKGGRLLLHDLHPVAACIDPVGLRWRENYFEEGRWRLGQVVAAVARNGLDLTELEELPPPAKGARGRLDPRLPATFLLCATKVSATRA